MTFDINKTINYWLEGASYDLETAKTLLEKERFPHSLFFAHLAIEKIIKAIVVKKTSKHASYSHSLIQLVKVSGIELPDDMLDMLAEFTEYNIEARYPDEKGDFYKKCTVEFTGKKFTEMEEVYKWFLKRLDN